MIEFPRIYPIRKPDNFQPAVQRWSVKFPENTNAIHIGFFAVQELDVDASIDAEFEHWKHKAFLKYSPVVMDFAEFIDSHGCRNRVTTAYWTDTNIFYQWLAEDKKNGWWESKCREKGEVGYWREILQVPVENLETLYWSDYRVSLSSVLPMFPTPYCGYFGAMRDRVPRAACDPMQGEVTELELNESSVLPHHRYMVIPPHNMAMIRSASFWGNCNEEQKKDYDEKLRDPLAQGMGYLKSNPLESGCCSLRFQQTVIGNREFKSETHAHAYFISLKHMEQWAEGHVSHKGIFNAAVARYKKYGSDNQLRTWHEVFILPKSGQHFEYINCHKDTGLLPYFKRIEI